jgi:hypothetical protein
MRKQTVSDFMWHRFIKGAFAATLALLAALGVGGCGKKAAQAVVPPPALTTNQASAQPASQQAQPSAQLTKQNGEPDLTEINRAVIRWLVSNKRRPASFEDFAATADTPIPPAPAGKKYVLAPNMHVQLVNQ